MKTIKTSIWGLSLVACLAPGLAAQRPTTRKAPGVPAVDAGKILDRMQAASHGQARHEGRPHLHVKGKCSFEVIGASESGAGEFEQWLDAGGRVWLGADFGRIGSFREGSDGKRGWQIDPVEGPRIMTEREHRDLLRIGANSRGVSWRKSYVRAEFVGTKLLGKTKCFVVKRVPKTGTAETLWIDTKTLLPVRLDRRGHMGKDTSDVHMYPFDWRTVDGTLIPFKRRLEFGPVRVLYENSSVAWVASCPKGRFDAPAEVALLPDEPTPHKMTFEIRQVALRHTASVRLRIKADKIGKALSVILPEVMAYLSECHVKPTGAPFTRYLRQDGDTFDLEAGIPVSRPIENKGRIKARTLPAGKIAVLVHKGRYEDIPMTQARLRILVATSGYEADGPLYEFYITDPGREKDVSKWRTEVCQPIRMRARK